MPRIPVSWSIHVVILGMLQACRLFVQLHFFILLQGSWLLSTISPHLLSQFVGSETAVARDDSALQATLDSKGSVSEVEQIATILNGSPIEYQPFFIRRRIMLVITTRQLDLILLEEGLVLEGVVAQGFNANYVTKLATQLTYIGIAHAHVSLADNKPGCCNNRCNNHVQASAMKMAYKLGAESDAWALSLSSSRALLVKKSFHVPLVTKILLFVSKLAKDNKVFFEFHATSCSVRDEDTEDVLLQGTQEGELYLFSTDSSGLDCCGNKMSTIQIGNAFLNDDLCEEVFMEQLVGFEQVVANGSKLASLGANFGNQIQEPTARIDFDFGVDQPTGRVSNGGPAKSPETYMAGRMLAEFSRPKISEGHDSGWDTLKGECKGVGSFTVNKAGRNYERKARQGRQRKAIEVSVL
ncbi:hypothetical protein GQ457_09G024070 [Hibiscus cannabinus]